MLTSTRYVPANTALGLLLRKGTSLHKGPLDYFLEPDGVRVKNADAAQVIKHHDIRGANDGLFADCPQSWRHVSNF